MGATGTADDALQSLAHVQIDLMTEKLIAGGTQLYEIDTQTGLASAVGGTYGTLWGLAMNPLAEPLPALSIQARVLTASLVLGCGAALAKRRRSG